MILIIQSFLRFTTQAWRNEEELEQFEDPVVAAGVVGEVDVAGVEGRSRLEVVREGLAKQFRQHS